MQNFLLIGETVAEILRFFDFFSKWRPSAILDLLCARLDHPRRLFGGIYLVGIDVVVSTICKCWYFDVDIVWLEKENAYSGPKMVFGYFTPKMGSTHIAPPKSTSLCRSTSYNIQLVKIGLPVVAQLNLLPHPRNPMLLMGKHSPKVFLSVWASASPWFLGSTRLSIPNGSAVLHSSRHSVRLIKSVTTSAVKTWSS